MAATDTETVGLNLDGNFATQAEKDAAAAEALADALDKVEKKATDASKARKVDIFGKFTSDKVRQQELAQRQSQDKLMQAHLDKVYRERLDKQKADIKRRQELRDKANSAAGTVGGGAKMAAGAALAYAGASSAMGLAQIAMGYRGMAVLQALSFRAQYQFRQLFRGVDSTPVLRAADRLSQLVNGATPAGKALQGIFTRSFNAIFEAVEKAEPYVSAFFKGAIIMALKLETQYYRIRTAFLPFTEAIAGAIGPTRGMEIAAYGGAAAVTYLGIAALGAAGPFLAMVAAIGKAIEQAQKLKSEWPELMAARQKEKNAAALNAMGDVGYDSAGEVYGAHVGKQAKRVRIENGKAIEEFASPDQEKADAVAKRAAGMATGEAYADGLAQGLASGAPGVAAAADALGGVVDKTVRDKTETHSPSRVAFRSGADYGEGAALGVESKVGRVQDAAASLAPSGVGVGPSGTAAAVESSARRELHLYLHSDGTLPASAQVSVRDALVREFHAFAAQLGVSLELGAPT